MCMKKRKWNINRQTNWVRQSVIIHGFKHSYYKRDYIYSFLLYTLTAGLGLLRCAQGTVQRACRCSMTLIALLSTGRLQCGVRGKYKGILHIYVTAVKLSRFPKFLTIGFAKTPLKTWDNIAIWCSNKSIMLPTVWSTGNSYSTMAANFHTPFLITPSHD